MRLEFSDHFVQKYEDAPHDVCRIFDKQAQFLLSDIRHPSLHAKKYDERYNIWQARVNRDWRFYFTINGDAYYIIDMKPHPK